MCFLLFLKFVSKYSCKSNTSIRHNATTEEIVQFFFLHKFAKYVSELVSLFFMIITVLN